MENVSQERRQSDSILLYLSRDGRDNEDFWENQRHLASEMSNIADMSLKEEQREKFAKRRIGLVADTAYFTTFIFCILWCVSNTLLTPVSYVFGALFGLAYSYGLGKYVETLGGSAEDAGEVQGAGVGQARFAFLILLFVIVGKFRTQGLQEIPAILGFFTYQLATLSQGLKEFND